MKMVTKPVQFRINLESFEKRRRYLERVAGDINNTLIEDTLTPSERSKLYTNLINTVSLIHAGQKDAILEDMNRRLSMVEKRKS